MIIPSPGLAGHDIMVTGASGFLGSAFVRFAVHGGAAVTAIYRRASNPWRLADVAGSYRGIAAPLDALPAGIGPPSVMVHFAAAGVNQLSDDFDDLVATNVAGTAHVLEYARREGVKRLVLVGTSAEYGSGVLLSEDAPLRPTSEYGASRASAALLARAYASRKGLDVVIVRPFAVYGPYEADYRLVPHVILGALRGGPVRISSGRQTRDYVYVDDVCEGIARAAASAAAANATFNLCSGVETSVLELASLACELAGAPGTLEAGAVPTVPGEMWRTTGDPTCAREVLKWTARTDVHDGLARTIEWFRSTGIGLPAYVAHGS